MLFVKNICLTSLVFLSYCHIGLAETQTQSLANQAGAVDVYQLSCSPLNGRPTTYATLKIQDTTALTATAPQKINVALSKTGAQSVIKPLAEGSTEQYLLKAGNGKYTLTLDTIVKNVRWTTHNYQLYYQCLNSADVATTSSATGLKAGAYVAKSIAYNKKQSYTMTCAANKKVSPSDTSYLLVALSSTTNNTNNNQSYLNAQLTTLDPTRTVNASDRFGDDLYGTEVKLEPVDYYSTPPKPKGDNSYLISVDTTANQETLIKAKSYTFNYGCYGSDGQATSGILTQIQDQ
ncbi:MAG: hypothetical protein EBR59_09620 [Methylococcaceae bacterium]|nr:hypothetical protein [Methylococcaceae bacterium]